MKSIIRTELSEKWSKIHFSNVYIMYILQKKTELTRFDGKFNLFFITFIKGVWNLK